MAVEDGDILPFAAFGLVNGGEGDTSGIFVEDTGNLAFEAGNGAVSLGQVVNKDFQAGLLVIEGSDPAIAAFLLCFFGFAGEVCFEALNEHIDVCSIHFVDQLLQALANLATEDMSGDPATDKGVCKGNKGSVVAAEHSQIGGFSEEIDGVAGKLANGTLDSTGRSLNIGAEALCFANHGSGAAIANAQWKHLCGEAVDNIVESIAISATEAVDGLMGIANAHKLAFVAGFEGANSDFKLKSIRVLQFVNEDPAILEEVSTIYDREPEHIVKIDDGLDFCGLAQKLDCKGNCILELAIVVLKLHIVVREQFLENIGGSLDTNAVDNTAHTSVFSEGDELASGGTIAFHGVFADMSLFNSLLEQLPRFVLFDVDFGAATHIPHPSCETEGVKGLDGDTIEATDRNVLCTGFIDEFVSDVLVEGHKQGSTLQTAVGCEGFDGCEDGEGFAASSLSIDDEVGQAAGNGVDNCGLVGRELGHVVCSVEAGFWAECPVRCGVERFSRLPSKYTPDFIKGSSAELSGECQEFN